MKYETLIDVATLREHLGAPDWAMVDCRFELTLPEAGRQAFRDGHIPGAVYAHLDQDLSRPVTPTSGRHPLPEAESFAHTVARWGIDAGTQVVAYDAANGAFAARLWWMLRWLGHTRVAVLDGGFSAWQRAALPIQMGVPPIPAPPKKFIPRVQADAWLSADRVMHDLAQDSILLVDARGADRFAGQNETIDPVAGHIPGAHNHPFPTNLNAQQQFLPPARLRENWLKTLAGKPSAALVSMCGSGVTACHNLLALEIAGLPGGRLYAGSWSEWIRNPARPIQNP